MKRLFIAGMILSLLLSLFASEEMTVEELRQLVQEEQKHLTDLLDEITFLTNLLEKKFIIKAHLQDGEIAKIKALFMKDQKEIDLLYEQLQGKKMLAFNNQLKALYGDIEVIEPFLLFNDARGFYLESQYEKAQKELEDIIDYHSNFELLDEAILLLQEIYFKLGLHKEFVSLYVKASNKNTEIQKYWLGHSHYNIGNYQEAEKIFTSLLDNNNFGFRSDAMLALISNYMQGTEYAIGEFNQLLKSYPPETEHYHFGILSLARLYADIDEIDIALEYYDLYSKHYPGEIPDELLFEIGLMNKNHGKYLKAISYFNKILKKPIKSEYYASAKILATISQKQSGQFGEIETGLTEIISLNDVLLETLNAKYGLMDKYKELTQNLEDYKDNPAQRETIQTQIEQVEQMLFNTNKTVENLYSGDDVTTLAAISIMEEEYMYYTETIDMMNSVVELAKTTPNKRIPKNIDRSIEAGDYDILNLTILGFLGHLPQNKFSTADYEFAQSLALEKIYDSQLIEMWEKIKQLAEEVDHEIIALLADKYVTLLEQNLESYEVIAKYRFSGAPPQEFKDMIKEEIVSIEDNNKELEDLKQEVIEKFNKKIAERLDKQKQVLVVENQNLRDFYDKVLGEVVTDVRNERNKNEFTLLDILYKQAKGLDLEYQVKQSEMREKAASNNSGNE